jgi:hypothetical protein
VTVGFFCLKGCQKPSSRINCNVMLNALRISKDYLVDSSDDAFDVSFLAKNSDDAYDASFLAKNSDDAYDASFSSEKL